MENDRESIIYDVKEHAASVFDLTADKNEYLNVICVMIHKP